MNKEYIKSEVERLHDAGYSIRNIAEEIGISKSNVGRIVKEIQELSQGTCSGTRPIDVPLSTGTCAGTEIEVVPEIDRDSQGTIGSNEQIINESIQEIQQSSEEALANEKLMMWYYKQSLHSSYQEFLYNMRTFLTKNLVNEDLARSLIKSRQERVEDFISRARGICLNSGVAYGKLYIAYVLEELYCYLGQELELEKTGYELKIKAGVVLEQYVKRIARLDVFTTMEDGVVRFPSINTQYY